MRTLLLLRGCPGCGKSTWIEQNNLKPYTLSADDIRLLYRSPYLNSNGNMAIEQKVNQKTWQTLYEILEERMKAGEFTVIDACNSKTSEMNAYKPLAAKYRYKIYCVDFTDTPIEVVKQQNLSRPDFKRVNEDVIDLYYSRFQAQQIPSGIKILNKEEVFDTILQKTIDLSNYENIYVIGDIHGCNTALKSLLNEGIKENNYYIFLGDYLDRGLENRQVLEFFITIKDLENVCLLEGNHEKHLWNYANDLEISSPEFNAKTIFDIEGVSKKDIRQFYRRLRQCIDFTYQNQRYICTHAGLSGINKNLLFTASVNMIRGVGGYEDIYDCQKSFDERHKDIIQINGHRNPKHFQNLKQSDNCYNLESQVEFGNYLSALKINKNGIEEIRIKNDVYKKFEIKKEENFLKDNTELSLEEVVQKMQESDFIKEKKFGDISSFNFTKNVFFDRKWNETTTKARGLFINTKSYKICARSYEKFFNIDERKETELNRLGNKFKFPISCYVKYNGFLGILGYDEQNDKLLFCSKSKIDGVFPEYFEKIFNEKYKDKYDEILSFIKENNVSLVFEVIDKDNDPHIIKYDENKIILLDIIYNDINFKKLSFEEMTNFAKSLSLESKELGYTLNTYEEFYNWYNEVSKNDYKYKDEYIEGFVIEDSNGFMVKYKTEYYNSWKSLRNIKDVVFKLDRNNNYKGCIDSTKKLITPTMNLFYGFIKELAKENYQGKQDIITLRNMFNESLKK